MVKNVLIYGFGKMGKIYSKYLTKHRINWSFYDNKIESKIPNPNKFSHIIISCTESEHFFCFNQCKNSNAEILIEKPIALNLFELIEMQERNVFYAMVERFNPVVAEISNLINLKELIDVNFIRWVKGDVKHSVVMDVAIHDIDLCFFLFGNDFSIKNVNKNYKGIDLNFDNKKIFVNINCNKFNFFEKRNIYIREKNKTFVCDLKNQNLSIYDKNGEFKIEIQRKECLEEELLFFLDGGKLNSFYPHKIAIELENYVEK